MFKKLFFIILTIFLTFFTACFVNAEEYKVKNILVDDSSNMVTVNGNVDFSGVFISGGKLNNPARVFIDLKDTVLVKPPQNIDISGSEITNIKVAQFSTEPNVVRIVFTATSHEALAKVKMERKMNSLIFKFKSFDFDLSKIAVVYSDETTDPPKPQKNVGLKDLKDKYFVATGIYSGANQILLSGVGSLKLNKSMILSNPTRLVFDLPDFAIQNNNILGEYTLQNKDKIKISKYDYSTLRVVITTNSPEKYRAILSPDLQSVLFSSSSPLDVSMLPDGSAFANVTSIDIKKENPQETIILMSFDKPVIHSLQQNPNNFLIDLYNVKLQENKNAFFAVQNTPQFAGFKVGKVHPAQLGTQLSIPIQNTLKINTGMSYDGTNLAIRLKGTYVFPKTRDDCKAYICKPGCKMVVIDAGHGGKDCGAIYKGIDEKSINLDIAKMVQQNLTKAGVNVILTRSDDTFISLAERVNIANSSNPNIFVSIHVNASERASISGLETHWYQPQSTDLARVIHGKMAARIDSPDRGLFKSMFYVINHTKMPAILLEVGFLSNPKDRTELMSDKRKRETARAISDGILEYLGKN